MATLKIDSILVNFVKKVIESGYITASKNTISDIVEHSVLYFSNKHTKCLSCDFHRDMIVGLEIGRQRLALDKFGHPADENDGHWIAISKEVLDVSKNFSRHYRGSAKATVEQAILEHLTRPSSCKSCLVFEEMRQKISSLREKGNGNNKSSKTKVCTSPPTHRVQPNGCSCRGKEAGGIC